MGALELHCLETEDSVKICDCSTVQIFHILPTLCVKFLMNMFWDTRSAIAHQHLPHHNPAHHTVLPLPKWTNLCGALHRDKWPCTAIIKMTSYEELWNRLSSLLHHKYFGTCHIEHAVHQDAWNMTMHIPIHWTYSNSHQMEE